MRRIKILGLAAVAVLAMTAFAAAGSASAATICSNTGTTVSPCDTSYAPYTGNLSGGLVKHGGNATAVLVSASLGTVTCTGSSFAGHVTANGTPVVGGLDSLSFSGCTDASANPCSATSAGLASGTASDWKVTADNTGGAAGSDGSMSVFMSLHENGTAATGTVSVTCTVFGFPVTCSYKGTGANGSVMASLYNDNNASRPDTTSSNSQAYFNGVGLSSSNCLNDNATWTANYKLTTSANVNLRIK